MEFFTSARRQYIPGTSKCIPLGACHRIRDPFAYQSDPAGALKAISIWSGLLTTIATENPKLGVLVYELTDMAFGLAFGQPAGIPYVVPYVPIDPVINPPNAW
jgi:hypothetical protein